MKVLSMRVINHEGHRISMGLVEIIIMKEQKLVTVKLYVKQFLLVILHVAKI